jgi:hypothetical protein
MNHLVSLEADTQGGRESLGGLFDSEPAEHEADVDPTRNASSRMYRPDLRRVRRRQDHRRPFWLARKREALPAARSQAHRVMLFKSSEAGIASFLRCVRASSRRKRRTRALKNRCPAAVYTPGK